MEIIIVFISIVLGIVIGRLTKTKRPIGTLRVDWSDHSCEPYLFLELSTDVYTIMQKKYVVFQVRVEDFLPRE